MSKQRITPTLWFDGNGEEAANFYVSIFKNSKIHSLTPHTGAEPGPQRGALLIHFQLDGQDFLALDGGPEFKFTEAISLTVYCDGQKEVDEYWSKLLAGGGKEVQCGWLKDRYGLSWQVTPDILLDMINDKDEEARTRAFSAMMTMKKIDIAELKRAFAGETVRA